MPEAILYDRCRGQIDGRVSFTDGREERFTTSVGRVEVSGWART